MDVKPKLQKANFCKDFIVPWTTKAAHYIDLYRRIQQRGGISVEKIQRWNFILCWFQIFSSEGMPDDCVRFAIKDLVWMQEESYCSRIWFLDDQSWPDHIHDILWPGLEKDLDFPIVMLMPNLTTCPLFIVVVTYESDSIFSIILLKISKNYKFVE